MSERVIGAPKHPQILFIGFEDEDPEVVAMGALGAASLIIHSYADFDGLRLAEWDVAVARGRMTAEGLSTGDLLSLLEGDTFVFAYGGAPTGYVEPRHGDAAAVLMTSSGRQRSPSLHMTPPLSHGLGRLVLADLVPWLQSQPLKPFLKYGGHKGRAGGAGWSNPSGAKGTALVEDPDGNHYAGHYALHRPDDSYGPASSLTIPHAPERPELWLDAAMNLWEKQSPERFADRPRWWAAPEWQTVDERAVAGAISEHEVLEAEAIAELQRTRLELDRRRLAAAAAAEGGMRRLLTASGEELVEAVKAALEQLGFEVVDMDATLPKGTPRMEDLRLSDPDDPEWTAICEVKGYARGGGKTSDLAALGRFAGVFQTKNKRPPAARWYVVNQFRETDPATRPELLVGADDDLVEFAKVDGLAIDTRQIFRALNDLVDGVITAPDIRRRLRAGSGRFVYWD